jgi:hypothetical protein
MERSHARNNHRLPLAKGQNRIGAASSDISSDVVPPIQVKLHDSYTPPSLLQGKGEACGFMASSGRLIDAKLYHNR